MARRPSVKAAAPASRSRPQFGHLLAAAALGDGGVGQDRQASGGIPAAAQQEHQRRIIDGGHAVRQGGERGDAAGSGGQGGGCDRLAVLKARFAQGHAHIHQAGAQDGALGVYRFGVVGAAQGAVVGDLAVADQQGALSVQAVCGVQEAGVFY